MSEQLSFIQLFSEKGYSIQIPIIQRDYAQGRKSASEVRTNFLDALYDYLIEGKPYRDLDFVYGDVTAEGYFIPLDGQQRLTTLFLLHWFLALKYEHLEAFRKVICNNGESRFTYKTRQTSTDFCNALLKKKVTLTPPSPPEEDYPSTLSGIIKDSPWYFRAWNNDPTIQSMLRMLDAIQEKFVNGEGFYEKLTSQDQPIITFQFLPFREYGLTDDLYIKMNSRGKPLSKFENFKAKFEQQLDNYVNSPDFQEILSRQNFPTIKDYFAHRIDTVWADLFWTFRKNDSFDEQLMNFISTLAINQEALKSNEVKKRIDNQGKLPFKFYIKQGEAFILTLVKTLDILSDNSQYNQFLPDFHYYQEINAFETIINRNFSDTGYLERVKFFAYYAYLVQWNGDTTGLADWMRVICNLSENTAPFNNDADFANALRSINKLLPKSSTLLNFLKTRESLSGFNPSQVKEERIKAHLLDKEGWPEVIYAAEKHPYFKGQLTFALAFSGIEEFFDTQKHCTWEEGKNYDFLFSFKAYINKTFALFGDNGLKAEAKINHRLHRALLSKGKYLLEAKSNFSFLIDKERDVSWKRLLLGDSGRHKNRKFFKQLLDDEKFLPDDLASLDRFTTNIDPSLPEWRKKFITQPLLFNYLGSFKYLRFNDNTGENIYLLKGVKTSGQYSELFTHSLFLDLEDKIEVTPFKAISYYYKDIPCLYLDKWQFKEHDFAINTFYAGGNKYKLKFFDRNYKTIPVDVTDILQANGFDVAASKMEALVDEHEVQDCLEKLTKAFSTLN